jgi:hypothetical protein
MGIFSLAVEFMTKTNELLEAIYISIYLSIYLSMALKSFVGPLPLFQFLYPIHSW